MSTEQKKATWYQEIAPFLRYNKCKEKRENTRKTLHLEAAMYRYSNGQISLSDFNQPAGMNLKESNRWVKKAQTIPWLNIEKRYAKLFTNRKGNVAKPLPPYPICRTEKQSV